MREKSLEAWGLRLKYKGEPVKRVREHLRNLEIKKQGGQLDDETWKREKAFAEAHLDGDYQEFRVRAGAVQANSVP
jgi:hypothetical protein